MKQKAPQSPAAISTPVQATTIGNRDEDSDRRVRAGIEFLRLMNWKVAWSADAGLPLDIGDASTTKVFGTEFYLEAFRLLMEVLGPTSYLRRGSPEALLRSRLERNYRSMIILTFGGGVNEVQRDLNAMFALGLPRADR